MRQLLALFLFGIGGYIISRATPPDYYVPWKLVYGLWIFGLVIGIQWRKAWNDSDGMADGLASMFRPGTGTYITPPKIREWRVAKTPDDILAVGADVYTTPFGNVGQDVGYIVEPKDAKNWNLEDRMNAEYLLSHPHRRVVTKFSREDIGFSKRK